MDLDDDADRLESIQALGGVSVTTDRGPFDAIFDANYAGAFDDPIGESRAPALTARSSDVAALNLHNGVRVKVGGENFQIMRIEHDGTGLAVLRLKR